LEKKMSQSQQKVRGLYFEEFEIGMTIVSAGRTITESDIVMFAGLSGDFNQIHTDAEYSKASLAGQRVAHGLLCLSIASGLAVRTGFMDGTVQFFREVAEWKFIKPVFIGDTIHVVVTVLETKDLRRMGSGLVVLDVDVHNQRDESVMRGIWRILVAPRPKE
jgi:3-hydroxybutyryl-CoA dehydratase